MSTAPASADRATLLFPGDLPDVRSGKRDPLVEVAPPTGREFSSSLIRCCRRTGRAWANSYGRYLNNLYVVTSLR